MPYSGSRYGLRSIYTPTGFGTLLAEGKPTLNYEGKDFVLENPIKADFALIKAHQGDRWGNLVYRKSARNFGPIMAMAADITIAQVAEVVELGELDPEHIITRASLSNTLSKYKRHSNSGAKS